ncbi:MAG: NAD-dependent epimerase/dehydratase family protein [Nocardioidaceae bacterium]
MKVFVTGATGVMGRSVTDALHSAGHTVVGLARDPGRAAVLEDMNVRAVPGSLFDQRSLVEAFDGCDVVCNMATHIPVGRAHIRPGAWKANDRIRSEGSLVVAAAAREAGVARLIQESVSFLYADNGDRWIDEDSPVAVTRAAEPVVLAETHTQKFACKSRYGVVLRLGNIIGDDSLTRWRLARAGSGHPVGMGRPESWTHVVHPDDVGSAVLAALAAPSGIYNVGAEPIRRSEMVAAFARAAGHDQGSFHRRLVLRLGGERLEWMTRSQRVSSGRFTARAGWKPVESHFGPHWLKPLVDSGARDG